MAGHQGFHLSLRQTQDYYLRHKNPAIRLCMTDKCNHDAMQAPPPLS